MKVVLDTSAYAGFKRDDGDLVARMVAADNILFSAVVWGELVFGFRTGSRFAQNMAELDAFLEHPIVTFAPVDKTAADRYARIATQLKAKGEPIPTNDIWIAAQAMAHGAELLTYDRHFAKVDGLVYTLF